MKAVIYSIGENFSTDNSTDHYEVFDNDETATLKFQQLLKDDEILAVAICEIEDSSEANWI